MKNSLYPSFAKKTNSDFIRNTVLIFTLSFISASPLFTQAVEGEPIPPIKTESNVEAATETKSSETTSPENSNTAPESKEEKPITEKEPESSEETTTEEEPESTEETTTEEEPESTEEATTEEEPESTEETTTEEEPESTEETTTEEEPESSEETTAEEEPESSEEATTEEEPEDSAKDKKLEEKNRAKKRGYKPPGNFFSRYDKSGFYAGLHGGWNFSAGPHLQSGGVFGLFVQWRQSPYLSAILQIVTGVVQMKNYTFYGTASSGDATLSFSDQDAIGYFGIGLGPVFHYHITEKIVPEVGLSFYFATHQSEGVSFGYNPGFAVRPGVTYELFNRFFVGLHATFLFMKSDTLINDTTEYTLKKPANANGTSIMLSVRYKLF